jgi:hypothetical protein
MRVGGDQVDRLRPAGAAREPLRVFDAAQRLGRNRLERGAGEQRERACGVP